MPEVPTDARPGAPDPAAGSLEATPGGFSRALSWAYALRIGRFAMTTLITLVLARLLGPEAFGVIAMGIVYVYFLELLMRQGLTAALVQRPGLRREHLDTAFWLTTVAVCLLATASISISGWWARVNDVPELRNVIIGLTPVLLFKGASIVQEAQLTRRMDFRALAIRTNAAVLIGGVVGITAAVLGAGVWALVAQQLSMTLAESAILWVLSDWRPRFRVERQAAGELLGFSSKATLAAVGSFLNERSDALLIGLLFGPVTVGLYRMASRFADMSIEVAAGALQSVSLPELSREFRETGRLMDRLSGLVRIAAVINLPLLGTIFVASEPLMRLLGEEWLPAAGALQVLCVVGGLQTIAIFSGPSLQACGRPGILAVLTWAAALLGAGAFIAAGALFADLDPEGQVLGLAGSRMAAFLPLTVLILAILARTLRAPVGPLLLALAPTTAATAVGTAISYAVVRSLDLYSEAIPIIAVATSAFIAFLVVGSLVLLAEREARVVAAKLVRRARGKAAPPDRSSASRPSEPSEEGR